MGILFTVLLFSVDDVVNAAKEPQALPAAPATGSSDGPDSASNSPETQDSPPFVPALVKVMTYSEIIGSEPFGGDVAINAYGKWIACSSRHRVKSL